MSTKTESFGCVIHFSSGNYTEALDDAKAAIDVQPSFVKAFVRGMSIIGPSPIFLSRPLVLTNQTPNILPRFKINDILQGKTGYLRSYMWCPYLPWSQMWFSLGYVGSFGFVCHDVVTEPLWSVFPFTVGYFNYTIVYVIFGFQRNART